MAWIKSPKSLRVGDCVVIYYLDHMASSRTSVRKDHPPAMLCDQGMVVRVSPEHIELTNCFNADPDTLTVISAPDDANDWVSTIVTSTIKHVWRWGNITLVEKGGK